MMVIEQQDVSRSLANGEFLPHFQPLVDLRTGELYGFEILARWKHPQLGMVSPDEFISDAEQHGWIGDLTQELLRQALPVVAALPQPCTLAVNISPLYLRALNLPSQIETIAAKSGFSLSNLIIEVTESALMDDVPQARLVANQLKDLGCRLALDDFGTGYSSLSHLQALPFDEIKVDRSFVHGMTEQRENRKIVAAVVGLGQSLGLTTVAEGVETPEQAEMLLWLGCELGQGWLYGKPTGADVLPVVLAELQQHTAPALSSESTGRTSFDTLESLPSQRLAQLQAVYDGAPVGLAFLDRNFYYRNLNRRLANLNGHSLEDHLGRTAREMVPELFPHIEPYLTRALNGESIPGVELTKPANGPNPGRTLLASYEPVRDEAEEVVGVSVAIADLTPLKKAEAAQRETEDYFRHMMELIPQIPWVLDAEGRALDVSQRWLEVSGMQGEEWRGFGWMQALHPDDLQPTQDAMQQSFQTGLPIDIRYRLRAQGADWTWMRARGSARVGANGKIQSWYGSLEPDERVC